MRNYYVDDKGIIYKDTGGSAKAYIGGRVAGTLTNLRKIEDVDKYKDRIKELEDYLLKNKIKRIIHDLQEILKGDYL